MSHAAPAALRFRRAEKYGFCAGVRIADRKVRRYAARRAAEESGASAPPTPPASGARILGQVVHNERVVEELTALGVPTVDDLDQARSGTIVFSAHGVPPSFHRRARERGLHVLDTTCPFVYDVHEEAAQALREGWHLVFIGDPRHREVIGYTHDLDPSCYDVLLTPEDARRVDFERNPRVKVFFQTTLNADEYRSTVEELRRHAEECRTADTICYATKENQEAARALARDPAVDVIVVVGGRQSANTRHLWEVCSEDKRSHLVHDCDDLRAEWFQGCRVVGITAGASTPDSMIDDIEQAILRLVGAGGAGR